MVLDYVVPFFLLNPRESMGRTRGGYDESLAEGSRFKFGDLVEIVSGDVIKCVRTTPANITPLGVAGQDWDQRRFAFDYWKENGIPVETFPKRHIAIFTFQHDANNNANHEFAAANLNSVRANESRELAYNDEVDVLTIRNGTTNPAVKMLYVFRGGVGDSNVQVACEILESHRMGA